MFACSKWCQEIFTAHSHQDGQINGVKELMELTKHMQMDAGNRGLLHGLLAPKRNCEDGQYVSLCDPAEESCAVKNALCAQGATGKLRK